VARSNTFPDGNAEIAAEIPLIIELIARTSRWVHPETFHQLPVWFPWTARGRPLYDKTWEKRSTNTQRSTKLTVDKVEGNVAAGKALRAALGVRGKPPNWTVCHIWGYDDPNFASAGAVVRDLRFFSCVGNMVWLPTPLKGFTDALPEIKLLLRTCAFHLYGWACEHPSVTAQAQTIRGGLVPERYPTSWPQPGSAETLPPGTAPFTSDVAERIRRQKALIKKMMSDISLVNFPREEVREVLAFWKMDLDAL
jgi:hypothetical protein